MTTEESKVMREAIAQDFEAMRKMLSDIEIKLLGVDPVQVWKFCRPLKEMICEAWADACNPNDSFLFPKLNK
jgi:hypothetical protein